MACGRLFGGRIKQGFVFHFCFDFRGDAIALRSFITPLGPAEGRGLGGVPEVGGHRDGDAGGGVVPTLGLWHCPTPGTAHPPCPQPRSAHTALFTETPHDVTAQAGEDVEMACSFRGSGSPSYSLEIQWWYVRTHKDWTDKQTWASGQQLKASHQEEAGKDATKISVVKVVGSNISHKLRLSRVKPADEGTYECRVIDASEGSARQHKVKAYLRVEAARDLTKEVN
ncbi:V-set and transmembrane domain-containing protein 2-like protein [Meleagris gallopavo]|uniref:V-set and transmembrane domain-containing protein 2-like protein n=1 Tax=Meleagris gallopavo TaxID=9103 RepID=UPI000549DCFF|nr:V-set and transmembrane domain-containing protein 2-like protein [Meleagris gallopavo]